MGSSQDKAAFTEEVERWFEEGEELSRSVAAGDRPEQVEYLELPWWRASRGRRGIALGCALASVVGILWLIN